MDRLTELNLNLTSIRALLESRGAGSLLLSDHANVAWLAGGGRSYVSWSVEQGAARVLVTPSSVVLLTSNNEAGRLEAEEFRGFPWQVISYPWWEGPTSALEALVAANMPLAVDSRIPWMPDARVLGQDIAILRTRLGEAAQLRARSLGRVVGETMSRVCRQLEQGESEYEIAGRLVGAMVAQGLDVPTCLVAVDDRAFQWRHFLPTGRRLDRYGILSVCARKDGLVLSCTRSVHFGPVPEEILRRMEAVCRVDAALIEATRPGATSARLFEIADATYTAVGFPGEWQNHHQGGLAGYRGREWFAAPGGKEVVTAGQLVAWNPTVPGAKSEDTLLVGEVSSEVITASEDFPYLDISTGAGTMRRPGVLVR